MANGKSAPTVRPTFRPTVVTGGRRAGTLVVRDGSRLQLARALWKDTAIKDCLDHYEQLVSAEAVLDEVETDLRSLIQSHTALPPARRIRGDIKIRQGKLQEALDTYRAALEQL